MIKRMRALIFLLLGAVAALAQGAEPQRFVVAAPVADMHKAPSVDADVVSQAIFSSGVTLLEREGDWAKIRTEIDGYLGWVRAWTIAKDNVEAPYASGRTAIVTRGGSRRASGWAAAASRARRTARPSASRRKTCGAGTRARMPTSPTEA